MDPRQFDMAAAIQRLCGGAGPDIVFYCAGVPHSIEAVCRAVRARGSIVNVTIWEKKVPFHPNWLAFRETKYLAVLGFNDKDYKGVVEALKGGNEVVGW